jgi:hypothetical protein
MYLVCPLCIGLVFGEEVRRAGQPQRRADTITVAYSQAGLGQNAVSRSEDVEEGRAAGSGKRVVGFFISAKLDDLGGEDSSAHPVGQVDQLNLTI